MALQLPLTGTWFWSPVWLFYIVLRLTITDWNLHISYLIPIQSLRALCLCLPDAGGHVVLRAVLHHGSLWARGPWMWVDARPHPCPLGGSRTSGYNPSFMYKYTKHKCKKKRYSLNFRHHSSQGLLFSQKTIYRPVRLCFNSKAECLNPPVYQPGRYNVSFVAGIPDVLSVTTMTKAGLTSDQAWCYSSKCQLCGRAINRDAQGNMAAMMMLYCFFTLMRRNRFEHDT